MENKKDDKNITISPRAVLHHLNSLGYTHITGQQLKSFIKDLKKLIKLDIQLDSKRDEYQAAAENSRSDGPERLHGVPTCSWKSPNKENENPKTDIPKPKDNKLSSSTHNCPNKAFRNCKSAAPVKQSNLIKVPSIEKPKKSDPVALYHYYASLWEKYKPNLPGENDWADLRWSVREKLAKTGSTASRPQSAAQSGKMTQKKKWVD